LGAHIYIDSAATDAAAELQKLGGAKAIIATATSGESDGGSDRGLGANGTLVVVGAPLDPMEVAPIPLLFGKKRIQG